MCIILTFFFSCIGFAQWGSVTTITQDAQLDNGVQLETDGVSCVLFSPPKRIFSSQNTLTFYYTTSTVLSWDSTNVSDINENFQLYTREKKIKFLGSGREREWLGNQFNSSGDELFIGFAGFGTIYGSDGSRFTNLVFATAPGDTFRDSDNGFYGSILNIDSNTTDQLIYNFPIIVEGNSLSHRVHQTGDTDLWFLARFDHKLTFPKTPRLLNTMFQARYVAMHLLNGEWVQVAPILPPGWEKPDRAEWDSAIVSGVGPVVVYSTKPADRSSPFKEIWYSYFGGPSVGFVGPFQISSSNTPGDKSLPSVFVDNGNRVHVVWEQTSTSHESAIYYSSGQIGQSFIIPEKVSDADQFAAYQPDIIVYDNGHVEVAWTQLDPASTFGFDFDLFSRRRAPAGSAIADAAVVK
jgi:hypothetical protein